MWALHANVRVSECDDDVGMNHDEKGCCCCLCGGCALRVDCVAGVCVAKVPRKQPAKNHQPSMVPGWYVLCAAKSRDAIYIPQFRVQRNDDSPMAAPLLWSLLFRMFLLWKDFCVCGMSALNGVNVERWRASLCGPLQQARYRFRMDERVADWNGKNDGNKPRKLERNNTFMRIYRSGVKYVVCVCVCVLWVNVFLDDRHFLFVWYRQKERRRCAQCCYFIWWLRFVSQASPTFRISWFILFELGDYNLRDLSELDQW